VVRGLLLESIEYRNDREEETRVPGRGMRRRRREREPTDTKQEKLIESWKGRDEMRGEVRCRHLSASCQCDGSRNNRP
jgi:hypothetical protein